ncbi:VOC family protein [Hymenobacter nivis]|uniref:VOC family protein n=1 Tax=Hymenobacter nivis TaxID=1850093 RepID=UPI00319EB6B8
MHLQVTDRALAFYQGLLGFELQQRYGEQAAFLGARGYHHHIGLNTRNSLGGAPARTQGAAGLYHAALLYPTRANLGRVVGRLVAAGYPLSGAADHGVSEPSTSTPPTATAWSCAGTGTGRLAPRRSRRPHHVHSSPRFGRADGSG